MLAIYGSGGFGRELIAPVKAALTREGRAAMQLVFIDDASGAGQVAVAGIPVVRLDSVPLGAEFIIAVGDGKIRQSLEEKARSAGLQPYSLFADDYTAGVGVEIGDGAVFAPRTMVTASVQIGRQFQCNIYSYVAHDCVIGNFVTFAPQVCCNGNVHIDDYAYIGTGAVIKQGTSERPLRIGKGAIVGMGAVVTKDVLPGAVVVGNPAQQR